MAPCAKSFTLITNKNTEYWKSELQGPKEIISNSNSFHSAGGLRSRHRNKRKSVAESGPEQALGPECVRLPLGITLFLKAEPCLGGVTAWVSAARSGMFGVQNRALIPVLSLPYPHHHTGCRGFGGDVAGQQGMTCLQSAELLVTGSPSRTGGRQQGGP